MRRFGAVLLVAGLWGGDALAQKKPPKTPDPELAPVVRAPIEDKTFKPYVDPSLAPTPPPSAEVAAELEPAPREPVFSLMPKVGAAFPQVLNRLSTSFNVALELSYITPLFGHRLAVTVEGSYSEPTHNRTVADPRVPDGSVSYTIKEQTVGIYGGPRFYFLPLTERVLLYLGLGVRAQLVATRIDGTGGTADLGHHDETGTHFAWGGQLGGGFKVGPGHIALELQLISSPIDHLVTGGVNIGDLDLRAGYLLHF